MEQVNHPKHYNARKDGLECIDVIRHYTFDIGCAIKYLWRDGIKQDADKTAREKEIEDLEKALWYINDELYLGIEKDGFADMQREDDDDLQEMLRRLTGKGFLEIANIEYYSEHVAQAMFYLLHVGLFCNGFVYRDRYAVSMLGEAKNEIEARVEELKKETY